MRGFVGSSGWPAISGAKNFDLGVKMLALGLLALTVALPLSPSAYAQSGDPKAQEQPKQPPAAADAAAEAQKKAAAEFAEAARAINGPAGNPECVWLGRRVVSLMWRDDLDTAFRHLDMYDRFGCPGGHIQAAFRCMARSGGPESKPAADLNSRIHQCWINPATPATAAASPPPAAPAAAPAPATPAK